MKNENVVEKEEGGMQFKALSTKELIEVLGLTIKKDEVNKAITFLCELSIYTESNQFNISFNAPSATGKSYIPTEIAYFFPKEDVIEIGYCSPTAFFHDFQEYDEENEVFIIDLSRRILIFLDQPHTVLLEHLRPLLSHDRKEIKAKITDKTEKHGMRTKNIVLKGYPSVIFCSATLKIDEQEATRFLLLSPETSQEKLREGIIMKLRKEADAVAFKKWLESNPQRLALMERIKAIKKERISDINILHEEKVHDLFFRNKKMLKPKHQRDIGRITSLIKAFALLNLWFRKREGSTIWANEEDINGAFELWEQISESQELNLPPYIFDLYKEVIVPAYVEKNESFAPKNHGLTRREVIKKHFEVYGRFLADWQLRQQIIPMLETSGLITQEQDKEDRRKYLIFPASLLDDERDLTKKYAQEDADSIVLKNLRVFGLKEIYIILEIVGKMIKRCKSVADSYKQEVLVSKVLCKVNGKMKEGVTYTLEVINEILLRIGFKIKEDVLMFEDEQIKRMERLSMTIEAMGYSPYDLKYEAQEIDANDDEMAE